MRRGGRRSPAAGLSEAAFPWLVAIMVGGFVAVASSSGLTIPYLSWDSHAYWVALSASDPYAGARVGEIGSFLYPPPFLQLLAPLGRLPWPLFAFGWGAALTMAAIALLRRVPTRVHWLLPALVWIATADIWAGNINLFLAYAVVIAIERPAAWPVVGLTKITPLVGALWHAMQRQWRAVAIAGGLTAGLAILSYLAAPDLWHGWTSQIVFGVRVDGYDQSLPVPLAVRLPVAIALLWWGARHGRPMAVPLACALALPVIWLNGLALGIGAASLLDARTEPIPEPISLRGVVAALRDAGHSTRRVWRLR